MEFLMTGVLALSLANTSSHHPLITLTYSAVNSSLSHSAGLLYVLHSVVFPLLTVSSNISPKKEGMRPPSPKQSLWW